MSAISCLLRLAFSRLDVKTQGGKLRKHLMDNLLKDVLAAMPGYQLDVKHHLSALESMLANRYSRQRLQHTCFEGTGLECLFDSWTSNLSPTRPLAKNSN